MRGCGGGEIREDGMVNVLVEMKIMVVEGCAGVGVDVECWR